MLDDVKNQVRGSNSLGVGQYNERLVLQIIRRAGSLPKAEIARMTKLSAQTVSVIINRLLKSKLLRKQPQERIKGKVGQPPMPIGLNPDGAFSIGIKIGRGSLDILVIDFVGKVKNRVSHRYEYPDPDKIFQKIDENIQALTSAMTAARKSRIVGIGVAAPLDLGGWRELVGAPQPVLERWNKIDIQHEVSKNQTLPVWFSNDAAAACIAELEFGNSPRWKDFLYVFLGTFIGAGVVQNGTLNAGSSGNAGAIASMLIPAQYSGEASLSNLTSVQLIRCASRYLLNRRLKQAGFEIDKVLEEIGKSENNKAPQAAIAIFDDWLEKSAEAISIAIVISVSVIDFKCIVLDGLLPPRLVGRLASLVDQALRKKNMEGLICPKIQVGTLGNDARAIGGAVLPFYYNFTPDMNVLLNMSNIHSTRKNH